MTFVGKDANSVYRDVCTSLATYGSPVKARGLKTLELQSAQIQLYNPRARIMSSRVRDLSLKYFIGELCYFLDGRTDLASIAHYSKFWHNVSDDGKTVNSAYGYRLFEFCGHDQIAFNYAIRCLEEDESSRKAVMPIYNPDDSRESKDNPCTMFLQLLIRDGELHMHTYMRSNDVWLGLPYDLAFFTIVQEIAFVKLRKKYTRLKLGTYYHNATSLHAYERDWENLYTMCGESLVNLPLIVPPRISDDDVDSWFNDLLTYEKSKRGVVLYKGESKVTNFQTWCKKYLD
jgi:thymidylate synthase